MKRATSLIVLTLATSTAADELLNQKHNSKLQQFKQQIQRKIDSIVHVTTLDEIPIFGGSDYRKQVLDQQLKAKNNETEE